MNNRGSIRVAVVDDGINEGYFGSGCLDVSIAINSNLAVESRRDYNAFSPSHGTTCAAIIKKYAPDINLGSIKILSDSSKRSEKHQLITAIEWCTQNGIKLINVSLGTIDFRDFEEIGVCVNKAAKSGLIIIAACSNKNVYTIPSCLTNVIGVRCRKVYTDLQYRYIPYPFDGIDVEASGRHLLKDVSGNSRYTNPSNSFAAPLVTAMVYKILMRNPGIALEGIKEELYKNTLNFTYNDYDPYKCINADWLGELGESAELDKRSDCFYENIRSIEGIKSKVWDPEFYYAQLHTELKKKQVSVDIPVIAIYDAQNCDLLDRINILFRKEGYYSIKISTDYADITGGCEYLPEGVPAEAFIALVYKKYFCDVILVKINSIKPMNEIIVLSDIILHADTNEIKFTFADGQEEQSVLRTIEYDKAEEQIEDVFGRMLKMLEGT